MDGKDMIQQIKRLVPELNRHRRLYYAENAPEISDQQYDQMFDALSELEKQSGCILFDSPTQMVGYQAVDHLEKATHPIPLLSLPNTKSIDDLVKFAGDHRFILMHKLDGLTLKLTYENGSLVEASTRGDGKIGENVTHNARAIKNIPATIPYKGSLTVSGEAIIRYDDFDQMKDELVGSNGKPYKNPRNLAAGSVRLLDAKTCSKRGIHFYAFNVLSGLEDIADQLDLNSKRARLQYIRSLGFDVVRTSYIETCTGKESLSATSLKECLEGMIEALKTEAERSRLPIDGLVLSFDDVAYSKSLGRVRRYFKDGIAFKFEDEQAETVLRSVDWNVTRTGELSATAVFDPVELENTTVSRATLHNLDIIEGHGLRIGHRIVVSKRMTTIPHVEQNLDKGKEGGTLYPKQCPSCGTALRYVKSPNAIHCPNAQCPGRKLSKLVYYTGEKALDIPGLSETTLRKLMDAGYLDCEADLFALKQHRDSIVRLDGFGVKSVDKILKDIEEHRTLSVERFITAMDIPRIGNHLSPILCEVFDHELEGFEYAVMSGFDFTTLPDIGETLHHTIHGWFQSQGNRDKWYQHKELLHIRKPDKKENVLMGNNVFQGKTIVATGTLEFHTRSEINMKIALVGAKAGSSVSRKTDYLIVGADPGSKLTKAQELGTVKILTEQEFLTMAGL